MKNELLAQPVPHGFEALSGAVYKTRLPAQPVPLGFGAIRTKNGLPAQAYRRETGLRPWAQGKNTSEAELWGAAVPSLGVSGLS